MFAIHQKVTGSVVKYVQQPQPTRSEPLELLFDFMSITAAEIKKVVLNEDDFGHEMRVGNMLNTLNYAIGGVHIYEPIHGETYEDPKTQKTRQFDYRKGVSPTD